MLGFLEKLRKSHTDDISMVAINEIESFIREKKYGLVWERHSEEVNEMLVDNIPVFNEVKEKKIKGIDNNDYNFLLEGDNLHSLNLLKKTHKNKIDVIYIDPPYNTGAKNWKYNNDFVDKNDGYKHSKFISFMYERLVLARELLKDTGVIVVTIDDYELENIIMLMNEIYGEENRLGTVIIKNNPQGRSSSTGFQISHEYALFYGMPNSEIGRLPRTDDQLGRYNQKDEVGPFEWRNFRAQYSTESPSMVYPIYIKKDGSNFKIPNMEWDKDAEEYIVLEDPLPDEFVSLPIDNDNRMRTWKWSKETLERDRETETAIRKDINGEYAVYYKGRMRDPNLLPYTIWDDPKYSASTFGANMLADIIGKGKFNYPKSLYAVMDCIRVASNNNKNAIVLDFFAGSGTTGHAVLQLNEEDKGNRKFILATNNENNICREVTYERLKKIIEGYKSNSKQREELYAVKLTVTNLKKIDAHFENIKRIIDENHEYDKIRQEVKENHLRVIGEKNRDSFVKGLTANLKFLTTGFIKKNSDDTILSNELLEHVKYMIELENMIDLTQEDRLLILTEEQLKDAFKNNKIKSGVTIYMPPYILLSREEEAILREKEITVIDIPDYYFTEELREVGEL